ncbi:MAG: FAD-dependent monooxygenase [Myxococcota bacterium]
MDLAVIGGGPAGAVAARLAALRGHTVVVLEAAPAPRRKPGEGLPPRVRPLLEQLQLCHYLDDPRIALPCQGVRALTGTTTMEFPFIGSRYGAGWRVARQPFETLLMEAAHAAGVAWRSSCTATRIERVGQRWQLDTRGARGPTPVPARIQARFVIDASGRSSWVARRLGARRIRKDRLLAVCRHYRAVTAPARDTDSWITVESVPQGWWYSCRLPSGIASVMYFVDSDLAELGTLKSNEGWQRALADAPATAEYLANGWHAADEVHRTDAGTSYLDRMSGDGWLAVGDAAVAFDPLSSQGLDNALTAGYYAAHAAHDWLAGKPDALAAYEHLVGYGYRAYLSELPGAYRRLAPAAPGPFWQRRA